MGDSEFDDYQSGPYGVVIPPGGLPEEYAQAYGPLYAKELAGFIAPQEPDEPEPQADGLPADVLASLELPGHAGQAQQPAAVPDAVPAHDLIEGFRLELPRGGWVQFGSVLDVSGGLRRYIITQIGALTKRMEGGKATAAEQVAVDNEVTTKLLSAIVEAWSYDLPLPMRPDTLDRLPGLVVDRISNVAAEYMKLLMSRGGTSGSETDAASPQRPSAG